MPLSSPVPGPDLLQKIVEGIVIGASSIFLTWFVGRKAQAARQRLDTRTPDQRDIERLNSRVGSLEDKMTAALEKIEDLRTEKMQLQTEIVILRQQIAGLEVKKAEFESRESIYDAQISALQQRLDSKSEKLEAAEEKLKGMEARELATHFTPEGD